MTAYNLIVKSDLRQIGYAEYSHILDALTEQVIQAGTKYDLIVPILRGGGITGMHLAYKLGVANILPAQYKHTQTGDTVNTVKKFDMPRLNYDLPDRINILVVDTNTAAGRSAAKVIADVQILYPQASIDFASANLDQSLLDSGLAQRLYYGALSNEERRLTAEEATGRNISNDILVFPWENAGDQWREIQELQT